MFYNRKKYNKINEIYLIALSHITCMEKVIYIFYIKENKTICKILWWIENKYITKTKMHSRNKNNEIIYCKHV